MLGDNIKRYRKERGFTQEELAIRLNVVQQTVSKWEKNLSVPDAALLQQLSEVLDVPVTALLGGDMGSEQGRNEIAEQLSRINEQLAVKNRRARRIWTVVAVLLAAMIVLPILGATLFRASPGHAMAESFTLSDDSVFTEQDIREAFETVKQDFRKFYRGCELDSLVYDEPDGAPAQDASQITITGGFRTGDHPKPGGLAPNHTYRTAVCTLSRIDGTWKITDFDPGS